jgi:hypothetical protein
MRDPGRIPPLLEALARAWALTPDWRFGQLVDNIARQGGLNLRLAEDDAWLAAIEALSARATSPRES